MKFTLFTANCAGNAHNALYPNEVVVSSVAELLAATKFDHVCAEYRSNHRSGAYYIQGDVDVMDCDNDHSDNPAEWIKPKDYEHIFPGVAYAVVPSRHDGQPKGDKSARPRHHVYFPHEVIASAVDSAALKKKIHAVAPFFDTAALDAARLIYGFDAESVLWHAGEKSIIEFLDERDFAAMDNATKTISEGTRNNTMSVMAGKLLKRYGNTEKAYSAFNEQAAKCSPLLADKELATIWQSAVKFFSTKVVTQSGYIQPEDYNRPPEWEKPIPFDEYVLPQFPTDALPPAIGNYATALAESTQTPVDMAAVSAIAVMSVCMQGKFKIRAKPDWVEPVNTFVLAVMNPSERKSAVENAMIKPLNLYEAEQNSRNAALIESSKMQKRILEKRQRALEDQVAKGKAKPEDIERIAEEIASYKEVQPLKLYVDDITTEKLTSVIAANGGRAAILSTEGGIFDTLAGTYSKTVNIDVMLKGYSGDSIRVDRIGRNSESILEPSLTVLLMAQPSVLSGLMQNGTFRGRGLTARFLYCIPTSFVGSRKYRSPSVPDEVYADYERCIRNLLDDEFAGTAEIITLSAEADIMVENFAESLEPELKRSYVDIADWAGKLVGNILRIAALLCRAKVLRGHEFLREVAPLVVSEDDMANAIRIGMYFIEHAKAAFMLMGADPVIERCKKLIAVVKENGMTEFTRRDIMRLCRSFKTADEVQDVVTRLIDYGYIAEKAEVPYSGKGRPPGPTFMVNPLLYK